MGSQRFQGLTGGKRPYGGASSQKQEEEKKQRTRRKTWRWRRQLVEHSLTQNVPSGEKGEEVDQRKGGEHRMGSWRKQQQAKSERGCVLEEGCNRGSARPAGQRQDCIGRRSRLSRLVDIRRKFDTAYQQGPGHVIRNRSYNSITRRTLGRGDRKASGLKRAVILNCVKDLLLSGRRCRNKM